MAKVLSAMIVSLFVGLISVVAQGSLSRLPDSSHYSGTSYYGINLGGGKIQAGRIEFAVYDTVTSPDEFGGSGGYTAPGEGRYIYAYQIFNNASNDFGQTNASIPYFVIKELGADAISSGNNIGRVEDSTGGVDATSYGLNVDRTTATFEFANGTLSAGKNSWFLILRSDQDWKKGTYSMQPPQDTEVPIPDSSVPEPMTMVLLLGGMAILFRRNRQRQAGQKRS
jgi:hypothetical protein